MRCLHWWTVGKRAEEPSLNEDAALFDDVRRVYAISDGASESFASGPWANLLVWLYAQRPLIDERWLASAITIYNSAFDRTAMSWSAQAAFDRGSFATLLGIRFDPSGVSVLGIGDSLAVLDDGTNILATFPYHEPGQFCTNPLLLSTIYDRNAAILDGDFSTHWCLDGIASPRLFCMTDAFGAWLLSARAKRIARLRSLKRRAEFIGLVEEARADGTMRRDDTTLLVIG